MNLRSISERLSAGLTKEGRERILKEWEKAGDRLVHDQEGAITSARTLLESVCKHILDTTETPYPSDGDLPKLYGLVSAKLGLSAKSQVSDINKRFFGAVHTIIQAVGELRNKAGDAHGKSFNEASVSEAQALLSVSLAGAIATFLLTALDSHLAAHHRLTSDGEAILIFDKATVWRLVDHARNAPRHLPAYGEESNAALWLVGDAGLYLMSNGDPPQLADGSIKSTEAAGQNPRLVAYAQGCGTEDEVDNWWPIHNAIEGGDDFVRTIPIEYFLDVLERADQKIVIVASPDKETFYSDNEWLNGLPTKSKA
jgi:hypothetical protein